MKKAIAIIISFMLVMAITLPSAAVSSIAVKSIQLNNTTIVMKVGQTSDLKVTFTPANTSQTRLTYITSNKNVATITGEGLVTAIHPGTATITVLTLNKKVFAKATVTVTGLLKIVGQTSLGASGAVKDGTTVDFWSLFGGADGAQMIEMMNAYNATNPKVKISQATQDWDNYYTKLKTSIMGGEGPELAVSHDVYVHGLILEGLLVPLSDAATKVGVDIKYNNYVKKIEDLKYNNKYYAIPIDNLQILFSYNKDIVGKAGLLDAAGLPKIEPGAEGFYKFMDKLKTSSTVAPFGTVLNTGSCPMYLFNSLYFQYGGTKPFVSDDGKTWQIDNAIGLKALETYQKIASYSLPNIQNLAELFIGEKCATALEGAWQENYYYEKLGKEKYGVIKLPQFGPTYKTAVYGHTFVLPLNGRRTDAKTKGALEFVKWFGENNAMWSKAGSLPAYKPAQDSALFKSLPMHKYFNDAPNFSTLLTFTAPFALKGSPEMNEPLGKLSRKEVTPQQCLDEMAQRMKTALK